MKGRAASHAADRQSAADRSESTDKFFVLNGSKQPAQSLAYVVPVLVPVGTPDLTHVGGMGRWILSAFATSLLFLTAACDPQASNGAFNERIIGLRA